MTKKQKKQKRSNLDLYLLTLGVFVMGFVLYLITTLVILLFPVFFIYILIYLRLKRRENKKKMKIREEYLTNPKKVSHNL